jgi:hypothetical protein
LLAEEGFADSTYADFVRFLHRLATEKESATGIGEGQRIASLSIAAEKPSFEVGAPEPVGGGGVG